MYDRTFWEQLWAKTLHEHPDRAAQRPPNAQLIAEISALRPGRALDAGGAQGAGSLWLAAHGWQVTAVDFSSAALALGRSTAEAMGIAERIDWIEGDLATWTAQAAHYDLVICLYVHIAGSVKEMVQWMAKAVAPGGTLFMIGHRPIDPATGAATPAAGQGHMSVGAAGAPPDSPRWEVLVAADRP